MPCQPGVLRFPSFEICRLGRTEQKSSGTGIVVLRLRSFIVATSLMSHEKGFLVYL
jgi:hypothetical protein